MAIMAHEIVSWRNTVSIHQLPLVRAMAAALAGLRPAPILTGACRLVPKGRPVIAKVGGRGPLERMSDVLPVLAQMTSRGAEPPATISRVISESISRYWTARGNASRGPNNQPAWARVLNAINASARRRT